MMKKLLLSLFIPLFIFTSCTSSDEPIEILNSGSSYKIKSEELLFQYEGGSKEIQITLPKDQEWVLENLPEWCEADKLRSVHNETITLLSGTARNPLVGQQSHILFKIYNLKDTTESASTPIAEQQLIVQQKGQITGNWALDQGNGNSLIYSFGFGTNGEYAYKVTKRKSYPDVFDLKIDLQHLGIYTNRGDQRLAVNVAKAYLRGTYSALTSAEQKEAKAKYLELREVFINDNKLRFEGENIPIVEDGDKIYDFEVTKITDDKLSIKHSKLGNIVLDRLESL